MHYNQMSIESINNVNLISANILTDFFDKFTKLVVELYWLSRIVIQVIFFRNRLFYTDLGIKSCKSSQGTLARILAQVKKLTSFLIWISIFIYRPTSCFLAQRLRSNEYVPLCLLFLSRLPMSVLLILASCVEHLALYHYFFNSSYTLTAEL